MTAYLKIVPAYYNDFDQKVCDWLEELIRRDLIPPGDVDRRSILDVRPDDIRFYSQCHFFAGIGGWPYALRLAGWPDDRPVWTASMPCQPFSTAGRGEGKEDARHLSPHFVDLVGACRPGLLFGEQVASAEVFGKVASRARRNAAEPPRWAWIDDLSDRLEAACYAVGASDFPSAGVGAPHIRQRTFWGAVRVADLHSDGRAETGGGQPATGGNGSLGDCAVGGVVHRIFEGLEGHGGHGDGSREPGRLGADTFGSVAEASSIGRVGYAERVVSGWRPAEASGQEGEGRDCQSAGDYGPVDAGSVAFARTCKADSPWRDADWLFCRDGYWRPVEPGTQPLVDGIPARMGRLRGYGNAINPWAAKEFIQAFVEANRILVEQEPCDMDDGGLEAVLS